MYSQTVDIVTGVSELRSALPPLTGKVPIDSLPLLEPMWGSMRNGHKTGLTEVYGRRFGEPHQRTFDMRPQGVAEHNGKYLTSWYYRQSPPASATKLLVVDPQTNMSGDVGLVTEQGGLLIPFEGHAGGIAVIGDYLYVADAPSRGFHVYDLRDMYPKAGNEAVLGSHAAFSEYDYFIPRIGHIAINNTPENVGLAYVSISGDGQSFVCGNYWMPNSQYAGTRTYIFRIPIDNTVAEFPAAQIGVSCEAMEPILLSGNNEGDPMSRIQGAVITDTDVLIMSRSAGGGIYQLIVEDLLHLGVFFNGNTLDPENNDYKNWLYGCEDLSFTSDGGLLTVTEFYDWRDIAKFELADIVGLMGVYLPPTIAEHQAALATDLAEVAELQADASFYQFQIASAIAAGLDRFDEMTYLV